MLTARLRNWGFLASDLMQGSPIRKHCEDIEARLAAGTSQDESLESLLRFAVDHTRFYGSCRGFRSLQDFPVITKATIKAQPDAFTSDAFQGAKLHVMRTSGSTGTPFAILQDPDKRRRVLAEMICFGRRAGFDVGDRFVFTRAWTQHNRKPWHVALRENAVMFDISSLGEDCLESLRNLLRRDTRIRCLLGYPSTLGPLVRHLEACGDGPEDFQLRSIICISEHLPQVLRERLQSRFGCKVVSRYSNQENGVLAQQCTDQEEFHLNAASYGFEYLALDQDTPAAPGARARIVVTDLYNRAMPMIRYDTGDVVVRQATASCGWKTETLKEVEGRKLDFIYDTQEHLLSPCLVCNQFWPYTHLKQFQIIQEARGQYQIVLNGAKGHYRDVEFIDLAKSFLGSEAAVNVVHVNQIPQLSSGKFSVVVNRYRPSE